MNRSWRALLCLALAAGVLSSCCGSSQPPQPTVWVEPPPPPPPPLPDPCKTNFDACSCKIESYSITSLDDQLGESNWTDDRRREVAANLSDVADQYKRFYYTSRNQDDAVRALRYYAAYLGLVPLSDPSAPFAMLQSIALYCHLGCRLRANDLVNELRANYRFDPADLGEALRSCG